LTNNYFRAKLTKQQGYDIWQLMGVIGLPFCQNAINYAIILRTDTKYYHR